MSIIISELSYIYMKGTPYEKVALNNINLRIDSGEFVGIIGHTGSGKSTLIQHINGLLKPSSGKVLVNGLETGSRKLKELRKQVGIVFQYPEHQLFEDTVYKDISFGLVKQGMQSDKIESEVKKAVNLVGLDEDVLQKSPFELSGGQKRRVAIAGILAMNPKILILDEPTAGLDPRGCDGILRLVSDYRRDSGATVILISHSMEKIAGMVDRIIVMNKGTIDMDGTPKEIYKYPDKLERMGLSAPQITYFMKKLGSFIPDLNTDVFTVDEAREELLRILK
jgi:energy-coupling factor transport system ATP-binding protein